MAPRVLLVALLALAAPAVAEEAPASCADPGSASLDGEAGEEEEAVLLQRAALEGTGGGASLVLHGEEGQGRAALRRTRQRLVQDPGLISVSPVVACPAAKAKSPMPAFNIDLDAAPGSRWDAVAAAMTDAFAESLPILRKTQQQMADSAAAGGVDLPGLLNHTMSQAEDLVGAEYYEEMQGLAAALGQPFEDVWGFTLIYSISGACTSAVGNNVEEGTVTHGRLLDYGMPVQGIQIQAMFTKGGETVFECVTYVGFIGCLTGIVPGGYSISLNQKDTTVNPMDASQAVNNYLRAANIGAAEPALFIRSLLTNEVSWGQSMLTQAATANLTRACYLTIAGVGIDEGVVFARTADGMSESRWMNASLASEMLPGLDLKVNPFFDGKPFVFITNDDWDAEVEAAHDERGHCAWKKFNEYDSFNMGNMWDCILNPCQEQSSTILATVMVPKDSISNPFSMCPNPKCTDTSNPNCICATDTSNPQCTDTSNP